MKLFTNKYNAAFLISPLLIGLLAFCYAQYKASAEMLDAKFRAVETCKNSYSKNDKDTEVTYSNLGTHIANESGLGNDVVVTGTATFKNMDGTTERVEMICKIPAG